MFARVVIAGTIVLAISAFVVDGMGNSISALPTPILAETVPFSPSPKLASVPALVVVTTATIAEQAQPEESIEPLHSEDAKFYETFWPDGSVKERFTMKSGWMHGRWEEHYQFNGALRVVGWYVDGHKDGVWSFYDQDCVLESTQTWMGGKLCSSQSFGSELTPIPVEME